MADQVKKKGPKVTVAGAAAKRPGSAEAEQAPAQEEAPAENAEGEQAEAPAEGEPQNDDAATSEGTVSNE